MQQFNDLPLTLKASIGGALIVILLVVLLVVVRRRRRARAAGASAPIETTALRTPPSKKKRRRKDPEMSPAVGGAMVAPADGAPQPGPSTTDEMSALAVSATVDTVGEPSVTSEEPTADADAPAADATEPEAEAPSEPTSETAPETPEESADMAPVENATDTHEPLPSSSPWDHPNGFADLDLPAETWDEEVPDGSYFPELDDQDTSIFDAVDGDWPTGTWGSDEDRLSEAPRNGNGWGDTWNETDDAGTEAHRVAPVNGTEPDTEVHASANDGDSNDTLQEGAPADDLDWAALRTMDSASVGGPLRLGGEAPEPPIERSDMADTTRIDLTPIDADRMARASMAETSDAASTRAPETISPWEPVDLPVAAEDAPMPVVTRPEPTWSHGDPVAAPSDAVDEGHGPSSTGVNGTSVDIACGESIPLSPAPGTPVVIDLAGIVRSGESVELVIEQNADGQGLRLRVGPRTALPAEGTDAPVDAAVPTPGADGPGEDIEPPTTEIPAEGLLPALISPAAAEAVPAMSASAEERRTGSGDQETARILADIRARLAALDARRNGGGAPY